MFVVSQSRYEGADGEVTVDTTNKTLRVHDGSTIGGTALATVIGGSIPLSQLPNATTTDKGIVKLNNSLTSTSTTEALTAAQGNVLADRDFGIGQYWHDVTSNRQTYVTYTNNTGKPIEVAIKVAYTDNDGGLIVMIDGIEIGKARGNAPNGDGYWETTLNFTVPNGSVYSVSGGSIS